MRTTLPYLRLLHSSDNLCQTCNNLSVKGLRKPICEVIRSVGKLN